MKELTQARVQEVFDYNQSTGQLMWKVNIANVKAGSLVGYVNENGYLMVGIDGREYRAHRIIFLLVTGEFPVNDTDHKDQNKLNNRWDNLQQATRSENMQNQFLRKDNTSGRVGVTWDTRRGYWMAYINLNGHRSNLGRFESFEKASDARKIAEIKFGFSLNHGRKAA